MILNLHKALLEAKFHINPDNINVSSSPFIADFCNELVDALTIMDEGTGRSWDEWRMLKNHSFYRDRALKNALSDNMWLKMNKEQKVKMVKNLLSPFKATEDEIEKFIKDVNEAWSTDV